jgi:HEAT repeat protein
MPPEALPAATPSIAALMAALTSGDDHQAEAAVADLARLDAPNHQAALVALREMLSTPSSSPSVSAASADAETRWWAARALAELGDSPSLIPLLADADPTIRQCAALGLRTHPDLQALEALAHGLHDPDPLAARLAADALVALGQPAAPVLIDALQNGPHPVRLHAVRALAALKDIRSIPALFEALSQDSALLEYWAAEGLDNMGVGTSFFLPDA